MRYVRRSAPREAYFLFRGVSDSIIWDAIETVLERHGLALVAQAEDGTVVLVGTVDDPERRAWEAMLRLGRAMAVDLAREAEIEPEQVERVLGALCRRRLAMELDGGYVVVGAVT